ncbi:MAG TPA: ribosome-recycling factor [Patescibacteria group bacterium]|jgi:ribosome recycling factor|nr:ribosome-recycling factor [Patescibacteria group bacterium]
MDPDKIVKDTEKKTQDSIEHFVNELKKIRTGRANAGMLEGLMVEVYGVSMPLNQVANIIAPEAQLLQVTPFDPNSLRPIINAIRANTSLGLNPVDDGRVIRLPIPPLTEERRREIAKQLSDRIEDAMISMRNARHESLKFADSALKEKQITRDDYVSIEKKLNDMISSHRLEVERLAKNKESEIMTI